MKITTGIIAVIAIGVFTSITFAASESSIPPWIKNNAGWWSDDQISDADYISGLQYLVGEGIIKIPIQRVLAADVPVSDSDRANTFTIRMSFGDGELTYHSFSVIQEVGAKLGASNQLILEAIPSLDKTRFYEEVEDAITGTSIDQFDVSVDIYSGSGMLIETVKYPKCTISDHWVYSNDNKEQYRFSKSDGIEIREVTILQCNGYSVTFP